MKILLLGANTESDQRLAAQIEDAVPGRLMIATTIQEAERIMRRNCVVVVIITIFDRNTKAFAEGLVPFLRTYGSVLDVLIMAGHREFNGAPPQGTMTCRLENVPDVAAASLADALEYEYYSGGEKG